MAGLVAPDAPATNEASTCFEQWPQAHQKGCSPATQRAIGVGADSGIGENTRIVYEDENGTVQEIHDMEHQQHHHFVEGAVLLSTAINNGTNGSEMVVVEEADPGENGARVLYSIPNSAVLHAEDNTTSGLQSSEAPSHYSCSACPYVASTRSGLALHHRRNQCLKLTSQNSPQIIPKLEIGRGRVSNKPPLSEAEIARRRYICNLCNKGFTTSSNLQQHRRLHFDDRPFQCSQCHKCFSTSTNLKQHYRTHTGDRPYACSYCPKRFGTNSNLRQHIRVHTADIIAESTLMIRSGIIASKDGSSGDGSGSGTTPPVSLPVIPAVCLTQYVCDVCNKVYSNSSNLAQHKRTLHPKDFVRRYRCNFCEKTFSLVTNLRRHQQRACPNVKREESDLPQRQQWPCDKCDKVCSSKGNLKSHKLTHLGLKNYQCFICEKRFTTNSNLKQHLMLHDGKYSGAKHRRKREVGKSGSEVVMASSLAGSASGLSEASVAVQHMQGEPREGYIEIEMPSGMCEEQFVVVADESAESSEKFVTHISNQSVHDNENRFENSAGSALLTTSLAPPYSQSPPMVAGASVSATNGGSVGGRTQRPVIVKIECERDLKPIEFQSPYEDPHRQLQYHSHHPQQFQGASGDSEDQLAGQPQSQVAVRPVLLPPFTVPRRPSRPGAVTSTPAPGSAGRYFCATQTKPYLVSGSSVYVAPDDTSNFSKISVEPPHLLASQQLHQSLQSPSIASMQQQQGQQGSSQEHASHQSLHHSSHSGHEQHIQQSGQQRQLKHQHNLDYQASKNHLGSFQAGRRQVDREQHQQQQMVQPTEPEAQNDHSGDDQSDQQLELETKHQTDDNGNCSLSTVHKAVHEHHQFK